MSKTIQRGAATSKMNMTPMIDVTFQLIIFFMLVNNIAGEQTVPMIVPSLENPKTRELGEVETVVVNVAPLDFNPSDRKADPLMIPGEANSVKVGSLESFTMAQMPAVTTSLKGWVEKGGKDAEGKSTLELLLRADAGLYYGSVQQVMGAITAAGVGTVNLVAAMPDDPKQQAQNDRDAAALDAMREESQ